MPLNRDAFDVADVDDVATDFQNLNFIVEHCGLPRLDDFCWIATQETNVYAGLAVALPFIQPRPIISPMSSPNCCSGSARTKSCSAATMASGRRSGWSSSSWPSNCRTKSRETKGVDLTLQAKKKILGLNAARLYGIDVEAQKAEDRPRGHARRSPRDGRRPGRARGGGLPALEPVDRPRTRRVGDGAAVSSPRSRSTRTAAWRSVSACRPIGAPPISRS